MKVKELITQDVDVDVYDNICESIAIAFVGPIELTETGKEQFGETLDLEVEISGDTATVIIPETDWTHKLKNAKQFFYAAAGYCSIENTEKWFID